MRFPTPSEIASAEAWALNPPDKRMHLVASVPVSTLLAFAHAARQLDELRDLLVKRDWFRRTGEPAGEIEQELKKRSKALAASSAAEES